MTTMFVTIQILTITLLVTKVATFLFNYRVINTRQSTIGGNFDKRCNTGDTGLFNPLHVEPYYTSNMNLTQTGTLVKSFDAAVRKALKDDLEVLSSIHPSGLNYITSVAKELSLCAKSGIVVGREKEVELLKRFMQTNGMLSFVSGGPSVGKSKLIAQAIQEITKSGSQPRVTVVHLDGRSVASLLDSLVKKAGKEKKLNNVLSLFDADLFHKKPEAAILAEYVEVLAHNIPQGTSHCVLVLDEATRFLDPKSAAVTLKLFDSLVLQTKQNMLMSAVLLSSDEVRLQDLGVHTTHLKPALLVGEIAPGKMLTTLKSLGVGEHLCHLLVRVYGGHLWQISSALNSMCFALEGNFSMKVAKEPLSSIRNAFGQWKKLGRDRAELVAVLKEVARCNFCELDSTDERAQLLTKCNVCTYLVDDAEDFFLDPAVRQDRCGVAASTQLVRVLIASVLQEYESNPASE